jgi:hypothetical protein
VVTVPITLIGIASFYAVTLIKLSDEQQQILLPDNSLRLLDKTISNSFRNCKEEAIDFNWGVKNVSKVGFWGQND